MSASPTPSQHLLVASETEHLLKPLHLLAIYHLLAIEINSDEQLQWAYISQYSVFPSLFYTMTTGNTINELAFFALHENVHIAVYEVAGLR